jgi:hypothetical protein
MKIGKYTIIPAGSWFQSNRPIITQRFLWFWIIREIDLDKVDGKQKFKPGTVAIKEGRIYRYCKMVKREK